MKNILIILLIVQCGYGQNKKKPLRKVNVYANQYTQLPIGDTSIDEIVVYPNLVDFGNKHPDIGDNITNDSAAFSQAILLGKGSADDRIGYATAQKDFDYTFYTTRAKLVTGKDTLNDLFLLRKISKQGSRFTMTSLVNTADEIVYTLKYIGFKMEGEFTYTAENGDVIYVQPCAGTFRIEHGQTLKGEYW